MNGKEKSGGTFITRDEVMQIRQQAANAAEEWNTLSMELQNGKQRLGAANDRLYQIEMLRKALVFREHDRELHKNVAGSVDEYEQLQVEVTILTQRLPEVHTCLQAILTKRMHCAWQALETELRFASQGAGDLMSLPGYTGFSPAYFFPEPSVLEDVTPKIQQSAKAHEAALGRYDCYFSGAIVEADKQIESLQAETAAIAELEERAVKTRKQRQLAIAGGKDLAPIDTALFGLETQLGNKRSSVVQIEDEIAGLKLRREELVKALTQAQTGLQAVTSCIAQMDICFIAQEYNRHAALAADFFKNFQEGVKSLKKVRNAGAQLPETCFGVNTVIPRIRLHWNIHTATGEPRRADTEDKYFYYKEKTI